MARAAALIPHAATSAESPVTSSPRPHSRAASEATTRGSPVPGNQAGPASDLRLSEGTSDYDTSECCGPMLHQPAAKPDKAPAAAVSQLARKTLRQRLARFVCCAVPQMQEAGADETHDVAARIFTTKFIIQGEELAKQQKGMTHAVQPMGNWDHSQFVDGPNPSATDLVAPTLPAAGAVLPSTGVPSVIRKSSNTEAFDSTLFSEVQRLSQPAASAGKHLDSGAAGPLGSAAPQQPYYNGTVLVKPADKQAAADTAFLQPLTAAIAAIEAPATPALEAPVPANASSSQLSAEPTQRSPATASPSAAISPATVPRRYSVTRWGVQVEEEEDGEAYSDDEYWDAHSYTTIASANSRAVSPRETGTLTMVQHALAAGPAAVKQQSTPTPLPAPLSHDALAAVPHCASTPAVVEAAQEAGIPVVRKTSSVHALLLKTASLLSRTLSGHKPELPHTVFRGDMLPHLPAFQKALQAPQQPHGPHKPLPFLDPDMTYEPIPAVTGYAGYWHKLHERSSPLPMPIDVELNLNWVARKAHESIQGIRITETDDALVVHAKVRLMGAAMVHKETYMKDNSPQYSVLRRDVKPGHMEFRAYWTTGGELVLSMECIGMCGRLEVGGVEVIKRVEDGNTLHCQQACYDYIKEKGAIQMFMGRREVP